MGNKSLLTLAYLIKERNFI